MAPWLITFAEFPATAGAPTAAAAELLTAKAAAIPPMTATPAIPPTKPAMAPALEGGDCFLH